MGGLRRLVAGIVAVLWIMPYLWLVLIAFTIPSQALTFDFPRQFTLANFAAGFVLTNSFVAFKNSFLVAAGAGVLALVLASLAGYGFSRFSFRGKDTLLSSLLVLRTFPVMVAAMGFFMVFVRIGLYNTLTALILIDCVFGLPIAIWNMRAIFDSLPIELEEAAMVDGCTRLGAFVRVALPIAMPGVAANLAYLFILGWNEYLFATVMISSGDKKLLTTAIAESVTQYGLELVPMIAIAVAATLPLCLLFFIIQRPVVSGLYEALE
jgi:ABC-type glycerol-3-phosphate transport system permease component